MLSARRPRLTESDALEAARSLFGVSAVSARDPGSERDRTFALEDVAGRPQCILKVSNPSEDPEVLDTEAEAALHVTAVDPGLHVAVPRRAREPRGREGAGRPRPAAMWPACAPRGGTARSPTGSGSMTCCRGEAGSTPPL